MAKNRTDEDKVMKRVTSLKSNGAIVHDDGRGGNFQVIEQNDVPSMFLFREQSSVGHSERSATQAVIWCNLTVCRVKSI